MSGYPAKQGQSQGALHGRLKRKILANQSRQLFAAEQKRYFLTFLHVQANILEDVILTV
jgi:hypothetical protein